MKKSIIDIIDYKNIAPGGVFVIFKDNLLVLEDSWGNFSDDFSATINKNTIYDLASITKLFTTAILLRMHQKSILDINDLLSRYIYIYRDSCLKIIDLLTHQANFGIRLGEYREKYGKKFADKIFLIKPPSQPSQNIFYENIGFIHLGHLIELVSGKSLTKNFQELFSDLDLKNTFLGSYGQDDFVSPPTELLSEKKVIVNLTHDESARLMGGVAGNAGVFANVIDLAKFGQAWIDGKIVDNDILKKYVYKNYDQLNINPQALGWWKRVPQLEIKLDDFYSHTGFTGGLLFIRPNQNIVGAFLCNRTYFGRDNFNHIKIWQRLIELSEKFK